MEWKEIGRGAAFALYREGCMMAIVAGPDIDGYTVAFRASGRTVRLPDLISAKYAAERECQATSDNGPEP
ncbi:MAG TPA: hypothetical protein PKZ76_04355 [Xanthomonadaceae bacterium]|nr:hypothetical protein [Xanthomonadaceae bacterium]